MALAIVLIGWLTLQAIPIDILPVFKSPATQTLTFYRGMPAENMEKAITNRMERGTAQAAGTARLESRSIQGVSVIRSYFQADTDPAGALTPNQRAGDARSAHAAAGNLAAGDHAVRSDRYRAGLPGRTG